MLVERVSASFWRYTGIAVAPIPSTSRAIYSFENNFLAS